MSKQIIREKTRKRKSIMVAEMGFEPMHKESIGFPGRAPYQSAMEAVVMTMIFLIIFQSYNISLRIKL